MVLAGRGLAACGQPAERVQAAGVDERLDVALADGRTVRLGGLDAPNSDHGAPEIAKAARDFLAKRLVGQDADLVLLAGGTDRWGRVVADLWLPALHGGPAASSAAALLAAGYARVRPEFETRSCAAERLAIEDGARRAGLGIWRDPEFAVIESSDLAELRRRDGRFVVVGPCAGLALRARYLSGACILMMVRRSSSHASSSRPSRERDDRSARWLDRRSERVARSTIGLVRESR